MTYTVIARCARTGQLGIGIATYSLAELKTITTIFSLVGFVIVAFFMFGEKPGLNQLIGFALIGAGSFFIFKP